MRKIISNLWKGQLHNAAHTPSGQPLGRKSTYIHIARDDLQRLDLFKPAQFYVPPTISFHVSDFEPKPPGTFLLSSTLATVCVLLCFIKPILRNRYVRSRGFIVSEPRETHPRSEIANVPTLPCPPFDNLGCPDPHPLPYLRRWQHQSPPLPLRTDLQLLCSQPGACALAAPTSRQIQSSFGLTGEGTELW